MVSLDELDLEELVVQKPKGKKKPIVHSRLHMDKSGYKYVDIVTPPQGRSHEEISMEDYTIIRVELGKITHATAKDDAQASLTALMKKIDKLKETKDMKKEKAEHYASMLRRIT